MADGAYRSRFVPYVGGLSGQSAAQPQQGGRRALFGWWFGGFAGTAAAPPPTPVPQLPTGGWVYDPYRRRRRDDDDDEPTPPPPAAPVLPERPAVDIAALDARIAALDEQIKRSRRGRVKLREQLRALEIERSIQLALDRHARLLRDDDDWFLLS